MIIVSPIPALRHLWTSITDPAPPTEGPGCAGRARATALAAVVSVAATLALPVVGDAAVKKPVASPLLWATVNVCDTADHPDTVGIRGSMPGTGVREQEMYMRFQLQYLAADDGKWHNIGASGDSRWIDVGSGRFRQRQTGRNFTVNPPRTGAFTLRGAVTFEWRAGTDVVRRSRRHTTVGHGNTAGADPKDFSAATCSVKK